MKVLFVTSEVAGVFKLGGLADVSYALPAALGRLGVSVSVAMPHYRESTPERVTSMGDLLVPFGGTREVVGIAEAEAGSARVPLVLFHHPMLRQYDHAAALDIHERFAFYCQAVACYVEAAAIRGEGFSVIHAHDWHAALLPVLLGESQKAATRSQFARRSRETMVSEALHTLLTVHNPGYHGIVPLAMLKKLDGINEGVLHGFRQKSHNLVSLLREGLERADAITTVSPTFAREMATGGYAYVTDVLRRRRDRLYGILNGVDTALWDPRTDREIAFRYTKATALEIKPKLKRLLRDELGLPHKDVALLGFVGRLDANQKGLDILVEALGKLLSRDAVQFVMLGIGKKEDVTKIEALRNAFPKSFAFVNAFDEPLSRRIYAGVDMFTVPSKYEPCGLTQMIAMRYGTIPIVRKTGGLADTVEDGKTGFSFEKYSASALVEAVERSIAAWQEPKTWRRMVKTAMRKDFSWSRSAREYLALYRKLLQGTR